MCLVDMEDIKNLCEKLKYENLSVNEFLEKLKKLRAYNREDRFILAAVDNSPFSLWACDNKFIIKYWEGACEKLYHHTRSEILDHETNYLTKFVTKDERNQSEIDCTKIIEGKAEPGEFHNKIAYDVNNSGGQVCLLTNCFRLKDPNTGEMLQVEFGLDASNLNEVSEEYDELIKAAKKLKSDKKELLEECNNKVSKWNTDVANIRQSCLENGIPREEIIKIDKDFMGFIKEIQQRIEQQKSSEDLRTVSYALVRKSHIFNEELYKCTPKSQSPSTGFQDLNIKAKKEKIISLYKIERDQLLHSIHEKQNDTDKAISNTTIATTAQTDCIQRREKIINCRDKISNKFSTDIGHIYVADDDDTLDKYEKALPELRNKFEDEIMRL